MNDQPSCKKRKISLPILKQILYLNCDIWNEKVYNYKMCQNNCIYCSYDCLSVLMSNNMNNSAIPNFIDSWLYTNYIIKYIIIL